MLTVAALLDGLELRLLAGEQGLELPVRWVHISEVLDPTPWLSGGELLLTTGLQLETPERQREFVARLDDHQLAGLGFGTGFSHGSVPEALVAEAAERGFPVFEVPYELPFIAITEAAFTHLVNEQYAVLRRALAAHERLERLVLAERGIDALAGAIATLIGGAVVVFGAHGDVRARHQFRRALEEEGVTAVAEVVRERRADPRAFIPPVPEPERGLVLPVLAEGRARVPEAWVLALKDAGPLSDFDRLTLQQAVTLVALELLRARVVDDTERRLAGDVLAAALSGELDGADLARRLAPFGLSDQVATLVAPVDTELGAALAEEAVCGLVASAGALSCALIPGAQDEELFELAERIAARAGGVVGVGRTQGPGELRRSFHEARCALEAVTMGADGENGAGRPPVRVATYRDLGSFQLLLSLQDEAALGLFCDSVLGPLEASDARSGGELMRSLEAFIEENGQWERAARRLYCHRHTLRYRIRRIEELTGRSLSSARDRIEFWLALRARDLLGPEPAVLPERRGAAA